MITPVLLSEVTLPEGHPRSGGRCPVYGFVIAHDEGPVLVDTGVGVGHDGINELFAPTHHDLEAGLAALGIRVDGVAMVINTHLHFDHCGNNRLFRHAPLVAQQREYELVGAGGHTIDDWVDFGGARWRLVDGESEVLPGVTVIPTPGHTPGHQSVVVETDHDVEIIAGQAVYDPDELDAEASTEPLTEGEAMATSESARRIKALAPNRVYFSHDRRVWTGP